jgi:hypothetical protein
MRFLFILFLFVGGYCYGQNHPKIYRIYKADHGFPGGIEWLTLGTDGIFFYSSSCECGNERFAKGTWKISADKLYLSGFDSARSFPPAKVDTAEGEVTDKVLITARDYYGQPLKGLNIALLRNRGVSNNETYSFTDSSGKLVVDKNEYIGFHLIYECHPSLTKIGDTLKYHLFWPNSKQYDIHIDFAGAAFDREPIAFNYGKKVYTIRTNKLIYKGKVVFTTP